MPGLRVVLDTNVLVSGLAYPGSVPGHIVNVWRQGGLNVVLSRYILDEMSRVLPRLSRVQLSPIEIRDLVDSFMFLADVVEPDEGQDPDLRDARDQQVLGTLRASRADYLITGDKDLLALADKYSDRDSRCVLAATWVKSSCENHVSKSGRGAPGELTHRLILREVEVRLTLAHGAETLDAGRLRATVCATEIVRLVSPSNDSARKSNLYPPDLFLSFLRRQKRLAPAVLRRTITIFCITQVRLDHDHLPLRVHVSVSFAYVVEDERDAVLWQFVCSQHALGLGCSQHDNGLGPQMHLARETNCTTSFPGSADHAAAAWARNQVRVFQHGPVAKPAALKGTSALGNVIVRRPFTGRHPTQRFLKLDAPLIRYVLEGLKVSIPRGTPQILCFR